MKPTSGEVEVSGRIAALLELGSGFNPEFTGRENVIFNASILGLSKEEIDARFQDIVDFAAIGDFIDRPAKTYSSGMMLRLAFAVAINIDPEILIVDEALAVGDDAFQRKCFSRIKQLQDQGVSILLVSHSAGSIVELCDRAVLIDHGDLLMDGNPKDVINNYHKLLHMEPSKRDAFRQRIIDGTLDDEKAEERKKEVEVKVDQSLFNPELKPSTTVWYAGRGATISNPRMTNEQGNIVNILTSGKPYTFCYDVDFSETVFGVGFGMMIKTLSGFEVGGATSHKDSQVVLDVVDAGSRVSVQIQFNCMARNGTYFINCGCTGMIDGALEFLHRGVDALMFTVIEESQRSTGIVDFSPQYNFTIN
ncbi:ABC transporter ATP-binding protein [Photobacterium aquae]|uniref:ABC transporter ATP-binding protein n=1 Tax=Photobacterium aquae TaxID=1195763 RepID=A0A0J1H2M0_9GAMM|nr:ABC transporter ATP-binding protein [Photobacterium aquae]